MIYVDGIKTIETLKKKKKSHSIRKQLLELDIAAYSTRGFKDWYHLSSNGINPLSR